MRGSVSLILSIGSAIRSERCMDGTSEVAAGTLWEQMAGKHEKVGELSLDWTGVPRTLDKELNDHVHQEEQIDQPIDNESSIQCVSGKSRKATSNGQTMAV